MTRLLDYDGESVKRHPTMTHKSREISEAITQLGKNNANLSKELKSAINNVATALALASSSGDSAEIKVMKNDMKISRDLMPRLLVCLKIKMNY